MVEYFKAHDYASSYIIVNDIRAVNMAELLSKVGIVELRQITTLITVGKKIFDISFISIAMFIMTFM